MTYTMSKDGKFRKNIHLQHQITKDEFDELSKMAKFLGYKSLYIYLTYAIAQLANQR